MTPQQKLEILVAKLEKLQQAHQNTSIEIVRLREEVKSLQKILGIPKSPSTTYKESSIDEIPVAKVKEEQIPEINIDFEKLPKTIPPPLPGKSEISQSTPVTPLATKAKTKKAFDLEAFIGGNLINKIGILILIVGIGLFVKYAIDNGYFPPLIRLVLSFLAGLALVGIGYWLKPKYKTYSAVLFSGGMAVLYFSAYGGNAFYDPVLLPRVTSFILMVVFTIVTVIAAMLYSLEIIALLGLVGAYAVPFLLGDDSGNFKLLLSYIAIINTGVLAVSIRRNWRITLYSGIVLTWLIFSFWVLVESDPGDLNIAWLFNVLYFLIFYAALIAYNLLNHKKFTVDNVIFITLNAFIFFGIGMYLLEEHGAEKYQGLFTLGNGALHLIVALSLYRKQADKKLFYVLSGLFWLFLTISIGVQFDGEVRPMLWLGEAALLFWMGRRFKIKLYQVAFLIVLFFGMAFLLGSWLKGYYESSVHHSLFLNKYFLTSLVAMLTLGLIFWVNQKWKDDWALTPVINLMIPILFIGTLYFSFFHEIYHQFDQQFLNSEVNNAYNYSINKFKYVWLINYSFFFVFLLMIFNRYYLKNKIVGLLLAGLTLLITIVFLTIGMFELNHLRANYLNPERSPEFSETSYWIWIRYISYLFVAGALYALYRSLHWFENIKNAKIFYQLFVYLVVLIILSNELTTFMTMVVGVETGSLTYKVGFSILWALYSLVMIFVGFRKRSKLLRISGMVLFGVTLIKVFFFDLVDISTESRILLFVAIGVLLLITSYLYQRYGDVLLGEEEELDKLSSEKETRE